MKDKINIGGVNFEKRDVVSSQKIKLHGKELNSVFLVGDTEMLYPDQTKDGKSKVDVDEYKTTINYSNGVRVTHGTGRYKTDFNNLFEAKITGTYKEDVYNLYGCINTEVDISQNDNEADRVVIKDSDDYMSLNNKVKQNRKDLTKFTTQEKKIEGPGTYSENDN